MSGDSQSLNEQLSASEYGNFVEEDVDKYHYIYNEDDNTYWDGWKFSREDRCYRFDSYRTAARVYERLLTMAEYKESPIQFYWCPKTKKPSEWRKWIQDIWLAHEDDEDELVDENYD